MGAPRGVPKVQKWFSDTYLVNIGQSIHYVVFGTKFGDIRDFQRGQKSPLGAPRRGQKAQKWVSDTYLVNIGHWSHYVVFGTKFGAIQDFQRGKKELFGGPADPS